MTRGTKSTRVAISARVKDEAVEKILRHMDGLQDEFGLDIAQMVVVMTYAIGFALGSMGGTPQWDSPLRQVFPPMLDGWQLAMHTAREEVH